jgi:hypothetical protein
VFVEQKDDQYDKVLKRIATVDEGVSWYTVDSKEEARVVRNVMTTRSRGVIRICRSYARGYDLKLAQDAHVIVIANGDAVKLSEVLQMVGRGCRSQGKARGTVVVESEKYLDGNEAWDALCARKSEGTGNTAENLVALAKCIPYAGAQDLKEAKESFSDNKWNTRPDSFQTEHYKVLKKLQARTAASLERNFEQEQRISN